LLLLLLPIGEVIVVTISSRSSRFQLLQPAGLSRDFKEEECKYACPLQFLRLSLRWR
jgi:hypothetical protein